jgi:hypothetical protein
MTYEHWLSVMDMSIPHSPPLKSRSGSPMRRTVQVHLCRLHPIIGLGEAQGDLVHARDDDSQPVLRLLSLTTIPVIVVLISEGASPGWPQVSFQSTSDPRSDTDRSEITSTSEVCPLVSIRAGMVEVKSEDTRRVQHALVVLC